MVGSFQLWKKDEIEFQERLLDSSGLGDETYLPKGGCQALYSDLYQLSISSASAAFANMYICLQQKISLSVLRV